MREEIKELLEILRNKRERKQARCGSHKKIKILKRQIEESDTEEYTSDDEKDSELSDEVRKEIKIYQGSKGEEKRFKTTIKELASNEIMCVLDEAKRFTDKRSVEDNRIMKYVSETSYVEGRPIRNIIRIYEIKTREIDGRKKEMEEPIWVQANIEEVKEGRRKRKAIKSERTENTMTKNTKMIEEARRITMTKIRQGQREQDEAGCSEEADTPVKRVRFSLGDTSPRKMTRSMEPKARKGRRSAARGKE